MLNDFGAPLFQVGGLEVDHQGCEENGLTRQPADLLPSPQSGRQLKCVGPVEIDHGTGNDFDPDQAQR